MVVPYKQDECPGYEHSNGGCAYFNAEEEWCHLEHDLCPCVDAEVDDEV